MMRKDIPSFERLERKLNTFNRVAWINLAQEMVQCRGHGSEA
jgi:hypothetical protein